MGYAFLVGEVKFWSKVVFVVESGMHVLTIRTDAAVSKATLSLSFDKKIWCIAKWVSLFLCKILIVVSN